MGALEEDKQLFIEQPTNAQNMVKKLRTENLSLKVKLRNIEQTLQNAKKQNDELKTVVKRLQEEQFSYSILIKKPNTFLNVLKSTCVDYLLNNSIFSGIVCSLTVMLSSIPIAKVLG